jgi:hypothetical protein
VLQYAGRDEWLYFGGICKSWAALYASQPQSLRKRQASNALRRRSTSYDATAASLQRTLWACKTDADLVQHSLLQQLTKAAALHGTIDILKWARAEAPEHWPKWAQHVCTAAISGNQLTALKWLRQDPVLQFNILPMAKAAASSKRADLAMLQWICSQKTGWVSDDLIALCAAAGAIAAIDKLGWLRTFCPGQHWYHRDVWYAMIDAGAVASLQWLTAHSVRFNHVQVTDRALAGLQFAALRYLVQQGCPWRADVARLLAAAVADVQTLQWMREADQLPWTAAVLSELLVVAGQSDNVPAAVWLREQGAEWPATFLQLAVVIFTGQPAQATGLLQHRLVISNQVQPVMCAGHSQLYSGRLLMAAPGERGTAGHALQRVHRCTR